jgi:outer membrane receptor for ferrienterochelin and colicin
LFPSAYITKQLSKTQQIQLNYSRRIDRPGGRQLDPFADYSDPKRIRQGNPYLDPEYVDSYELNFQQQFNKSFIAFETFYRRTNNVISNYEYPKTVDTTVRTYINLNHDNSLGAELNLNLNLAKWWRLNASGTGYYYQILGELEGENIDNETFTYNFRINSMFTFAKNTKIQVNVFYRGPSISAQGSRKAFMFSSLAVRQDLMKNKLTLTAQLQDIFGATKFGFTNETSTTYSSGEFSRESQVVRLSLTYRLNNFKQKRDRNGNGNGEDMDMDMDM